MKLRVPFAIPSFRPSYLTVKRPCPWGPSQRRPGHARVTWVRTVQPSDLPPCPSAVAMRPLPARLTTTPYFCTHNHHRLRISSSTHDRIRPCCLRSSTVSLFQHFLLGPLAFHIDRLQASKLLLAIVLGHSMGRRSIMARPQESCQTAPLFLWKLCCLIQRLCSMAASSSAAPFLSLPRSPHTNTFSFAEASALVACPTTHSLENTPSRSCFTNRKSKSFTSFHHVHPDSHSPCKTLGRQRQSCCCPPAQTCRNRQPGIDARLCEY